MNNVFSFIQIPTLVIMNQQNQNSQNMNQSPGYYPPQEYPMQTVPADFDQGVIKQVIGRDGCYFKQITQQTGVKYIWHRRDTNQIEIWGPPNCIPMAICSIQYRLYLVIMKMVQNNQNVSQNSINWMHQYHNWYQSVYQAQYMNPNFNSSNEGDMQANYGNYNSQGR